MKKVRLSPKRGKTWSFKLFDSAEAAYYLKSDDREISDYHQRINIVSGSFMEVEWMGCEYLYDSVDVEEPAWNEHHELFAKVRIAKLTKSKKVKERDYIELAVGWVRGSDIPWSQNAHDDVKIIKINDDKKSKLDFSILFKELWKDEDNSEDETQTSLPRGIC